MSVRQDNLFLILGGAQGAVFYMYINTVEFWFKHKIILVFENPEKVLLAY
jgi:hypothetical protein